VPGSRLARLAALVALSALLLARPGAAEWVDWVVDAEVPVRFDSNLNRASLGSEEEWDVSFHPGLEAGRIFQLAERTRLFATARIGGEIYSRAGELDALDGGGRLALLHKFGLGDAPWARLFATGGYRGVRAGRRSGPYADVGIAAGRRLSPRFDAKLEYRFTRRWAGDGPAVTAVEAAGLPDDVFDQQQHRVTLDGSFLASERLLLTLGFSYLRGDFDSNAQASRFAVLASSDVEAVASDTVFGGWVYRVFGNAWSPFVGASLGLCDRWSLDLDYRFQYAEGDGLDYRNHVVRGVVLFRY
jgi:hypothetical protein